MRLRAMTRWWSCEDEKLVETKEVKVDRNGKVNEDSQLKIVYYNLGEIVTWKVEEGGFKSLERKSGLGLSG